MSFIALWLAVGLLGGIASLARFYLAGIVVATRDAPAALGTFAVNVSGSFVLGLLVGLGLHGDGYLLAGAAVIGSYTTFSTWMLDSRRLAERRLWLALGANIVLSLLVGVAAVALGRLIGGG
jgi:fluoride exporter